MPGATRPGTWDGEEVTLTSFYPSHEEDLVPDIFYAAAACSTEHIATLLGGMRQDRLEILLRAYMGNRLNRRHRPGRAFERAHFTWEVVGDYGTFRDLQRHRVVDGFEWQQLRPEYGFAVPSIVEEAGLAGMFKECFELSGKLHFNMERAVGPTVAQYAVLFGNRMRYRFTTNLRALFHLLELRTGPAGHPGYRRICQKMYEQLRVVYPITASGMKFINQDEDPSLTRLAAELAAQDRRKRLGLDQGE